jgi:hypothetical protein
MSPRGKRVPVWSTPLIFVRLLPEVHLPSEILCLFLCGVPQVRISCHNEGKQRSRLSI